MRRRPPVEDEGDVGTQIGLDVPGLRRAHAARAVGGRRCQRTSGLDEQRLRDRVIGNAQRHRVEPAGDEVGQIGSWLPVEDERQRSGPEGVGEAPGERRQPAVRLGVRHVRHVHDQRIEPRAAFGGEDRRHRVAVAGVAAEPVDRLGGKGDEAAGAQQLRRGADRGSRLP